jgi:type IV pilus assembly protein PilP
MSQRTTVSWQNRSAVLGITLLAGVLTACSNPDQTELKQWMEKERARTPTNVPPLAAPVVFVPTPYALSSTIDPYDEQKLRGVLAKIRATALVSAIKPDLTRKREVLESTPLDSLKMSGFVMNGGKPSALIAAANNLYTVGVGNYIGQDFGKIISINEQEVSIQEMVQDNAGIWTERVSKLALQVVNKEVKK